MSATNELRRMLAERGIETGYGTPVVWDCANGHAARATNYDGALTVQAVMTPEQAIAATLGRGECRRVLYKPTGVLVCSECGAGIPKQLDKYCYLHYCPNCGRRVVE